MATEIQGWQLDRIRAAAAEIADYFPEGYNDREIRAMAERALAAADNAVPIEPTGAFSFREAWKARGREINKLTPLVTEAIHYLNSCGCDDDECPGRQKAAQLKAALSNPAESSSADD